MTSHSLLFNTHTHTRSTNKKRIHITLNTFLFLPLSHWTHMRAITGTFSDVPTPTHTCTHPHTHTHAHSLLLSPFLYLHISLCHAIPHLLSICLSFFYIPIHPNSHIYTLGFFLISFSLSHFHTHILSLSYAHTPARIHSHFKAQTFWCERNFWKQCLRASQRTVSVCLPHLSFSSPLGFCRR